MTNLVLELKNENEYTSTNTNNSTPKPQLKEFESVEDLALHVQSVLFAPCGEKVTRNDLKQLRREVSNFANNNPEQLNGYVKGSRYAGGHTLPVFFEILSQDVASVTANSKRKHFPDYTSRKLSVMAQEVSLKHKAFLESSNQKTR